MNQMLCGYRDDPRQWAVPEVIEEDNDPRNDMEKRLEWLCDEWKDATENDTYEAWRDVRMMVYGASQALNYCRADNRHEDRMALLDLGSLAFQYSLDCVLAGRYEGATN